MPPLPLVAICLALFVDVEIERFIDDFMNQTRFTGPETPVTATIMPSGMSDVDILQIVGPRAVERDVLRLLLHLAPIRAVRDSQFTAQIAAGQTMSVEAGQQLGISSGKDDLAAILARARAEIENDNPLPP